jgi:phosphate-selective porin OprO/OprP
MFRKTWKALKRPMLCGTVFWTATSMILAQQPLPLPVPAVPSVELPGLPGVPPAAGSTVKGPGLVQVQGQLGAPESPPAPTTPANSAPAAELKSRVDRLEKQNQELLDALRALQNRPVPATPTNNAPPSTAQPGSLTVSDVQKMVEQYLAAKEGDKAGGDASKAPTNTYIVGKNLGLSGVYTTGPGSGGYQPWFESQDKSFRFHVGGRIQPDWIFGAQGDKNVEQGKGGTGPFLEGVNFRRARLEVDGWVSEVVDYFIEFDWSNTPFNTGVKPGNITGAGTPTNTQPFNNILNVPAPTDVWAGINYIPVIGGIRFGNLKPAIGLDHLTSSRFLDFMERSIGFDTYYNRNNGFEPGFMFFNNTEDKRATYQISITKTCNGPFGFSQGGAPYDYSGRLTWLPWYEDEGRHMIHLGLGAKYQGLDRSTGTGVANFNDRWLLRNVESGLQNTVSLAVLNGIDQEMINPEFFMNYGPLSVQAEYIGSRVNGVTSYSTQVQPGANKIPSTTFYSQTAYIQALYFLTGESRAYGLTALHGSGAAPTRVVPFRNYYWVSGNDRSLFSSGAWQVGARYCWSTLDDGVIHGGKVNEVTLGLNWFLNPNMKIQWNYDIGHRDITGGTSSGFYSGFGMRMAFDF